jgi:hypothetical protein
MPNQSGHLKIISYRTMFSCGKNNNKNFMKVKIQDFIDKTNFFLAPYSSALGHY